MVCVVCAPQFDPRHVIITQTPNLTYFFIQILLPNPQNPHNKNNHLKRRALNTCSACVQRCRHTTRAGETHDERGELYCTLQIFPTNPKPTTIPTLQHELASDTLLQRLYTAPATWLPACLIRPIALPPRPRRRATHPSTRRASGAPRPAKARDSRCPATAHTRAPAACRASARRRSGT
jgi:hypothetical protein